MTLKLKKMVGRCVLCGNKQEFDPYRVAPGDQPYCEKCLGPLVDFEAFVEEK